MHQARLSGYLSVIAGTGVMIYATCVRGLSEFAGMYFAGSSEDRYLQHRDHNTTVVQQQQGGSL